MGQGLFLHVKGWLILSRAILFFVPPLWGGKRSKNGARPNAVYRYAITKIFTGVNKIFLTSNIKSNRTQAQRPEKQKNVKIITTASQPPKAAKALNSQRKLPAMPSLMWPNSPKHKNVKIKTKTSQPSKVNKTPTAKSAVSKKTNKPKTYANEKAIVHHHNIVTKKSQQ